MSVKSSAGRAPTHLAAIAIAFALLAIPASAAPVATHSGLVEGAAENGAVVFKGIPYAAPPVGPLRWREPQPPQSWDGVRLADRFGSICPQIGAYPEDSPAEPMSEDCLYLNIFVPEGAHADAKLPVMAWVYGGGLQNGSGSNPLYSGEALAGRGVIVVTFNYRLGALGFLAHPDLSAESPRKISGNYGHLDQIAALRWVKDNIAAFGGDPDNVTVFGQSSGSISISTLCASPLAKGLFRRAIGQSGGLFEPLEAAPEFRLAGAEQVGAAFVDRLGAPTLQKMRAATVDDILAARFYPQANVDGHLLNDTPYKTFARGNDCGADILIGSNQEEGLYFISGRDITAGTLREELNRDFPSFIVSLVGPRAPESDEAARAAFIDFEGQMRFGWDMRAWARLNAEDVERKTYFYRFAHTPPGEEGASHGAEMRYAFDNLDVDARAWTDQDRTLAQTLADYWTNFAKTGNPNSDGLPLWPAFTADDERALLIGDEIRAGRIPDAQSLDAIDRLYWAVRFLLKYGYALAGALALLVLVIFYRAAVSIARATRRKR